MFSLGQSCQGYFLLGPNGVKSYNTAIMYLVKINLRGTKSEMETAVLKQIDTDPSPEDKAEAARYKVKFEVFGEEMVEKRVKPSGNSGRVYLPPDWVGCRVK